MFDQPFFSVGPEALKAVDIDLSGAEPHLMVDSEMAVTAEHQRVVAMELVGINDAASTDHLNCHAQEGLGRDIGHNLDFDHPLALENAEYRDFTGCSPSTVAFSPASKIRLICLDFTPEEKRAILGRGCDTLPYQVERLEDRRVRQIDLLAGLESRYLQFEQLDEPEPVSGRYPELSDPSAGPVGELVPAVLASVFLAPDAIEIFAETSGAKTTPTIPAGSGYVSPGPNF